MNAIFRYILFSLLILSSEGFAQGWSPQQAITDLPQIVFRSRLTGIDRQTQLRAMEWVFENKSDSIVSFTYRLISDARDTLVGRMMIREKRREYSGWFIRGTRFVKIQTENVSIKR
jgi:hypothetical protein